MANNQLDLITGATGLSGSYLVCRLLKSGRMVRAMKRPDSDMSWFQRIAQAELGSDYEILIKNVEWFVGDVTDVLAMKEAIHGCARVYHTAALVSFRDSDSEMLQRINVDGTANVVNACLYSDDPPDLCHFSSTATMGYSRGLIDESTVFVNDGDSSAYAISKYGAELEAYRGREEGLNVAIINPCIILGFGNPNRGPSRFFRNAWTSFKFYPPGSNAFVDVRDVAFYAERMMVENIFHDRFLCIGFNQSYYEVFAAMATLFDVKPPSIKVKKWMTEIAWRLTSITRLFGFPSLISRSSARAGLKNRSFSSKRLIEELGNHFTSREECLAHHCKLYLAYIKKRPLITGAFLFI